MKNKKTAATFRTNGKRVRVLAEISILLALATVLSVFKLYQLPYGGAFTLASMFPIILIAYRHGTVLGLVSGLIYGVLQQLLSLSYIQGMTLFSAVMVILLDYALAFGVIGFGGIFRKLCKNRTKAFVSGTLVGCFLRYICHTVAGCTVWAGLSIPTNAAFVYSLLYNAAYMIPETAITVAAAYYLSSCIDFDAELPVRVKSGNMGEKLSAFRIVGGLSLLAAVITDIIIVFSHTQKESGEFDITLIKTVSFNDILIMAAVTLGAVALYTILYFIGKRKKRNG